MESKKGLFSLYCQCLRIDWSYIPLSDKRDRPVTQSEVTFPAIFTWRFSRSDFPSCLPASVVCHVCGTGETLTNYSVGLCEADQAFWQRWQHRDHSSYQPCQPPCTITKNTKSCCKPCQLAKCQQVHLISMNRQKWGIFPLCFSISQFCMPVYTSSKA